MKKVISWILFILTIMIFLFDIYFMIDCGMEVKQNLAELKARGGGGMEYMAAGEGILALGVVFISFVGLIFSILSSTIAQSRVIRIISVTISVLLFFMPFFGFCFMVYLP